MENHSDHRALGPTFHRRWHVGPRVRFCCGLLTTRLPHVRRARPIPIIPKPTHCILGDSAPHWGRDTSTRHAQMHRPSTHHIGDTSTRPSQNASTRSTRALSTRPSRDAWLRPKQGPSTRPSKAPYARPQARRIDAFRMRRVDAPRACPVRMEHFDASCAAWALVPNTARNTYRDVIRKHIARSGTTKLHDEKQVRRMEQASAGPSLFSRINSRRMAAVRASPHEWPPSWACHRKQSRDEVAVLYDPYQKKCA